MTMFGVWPAFSNDNPVTTAIPVNGGDPALRAADVDGDGLADLTVYNTTTDTNWFSLLSGAGYTTALGTRWGGAGYTPVPADYDGDGKSDRGLYESATGNWHALLSSSNFTTALSISAGGSGWVPVPADYDGDGKADVAVFNSVTGLWYALKSSSSYTKELSISYGGGYTPAGRRRRRRQSRSWDLQRFRVVVRTASSSNYTTTRTFTCNSRPALSPSCR